MAKQKTKAGSGSKLLKQSTTDFYNSLVAILDRPVGGKVKVAGKTHTVNNPLINPVLKDFRLAPELATGKLGTDIYGLPVQGASAKQLQQEVANLDWQIKEFGGKPESSHHTSIFGKVLDVLSRPMYGVANATAQGLRAEVGGGSVGNVFENMGTGLIGGLEGKHKTDFMDVIQQSADELHAAHRGASPDQVIPGEGHVNPWLKAGLGLTADIFLDPTTYTGIGLVSKVKEGEKALKAGETAVKGITGGTKLTDEEMKILSGAKVIGKGKSATIRGTKDIQPLVARVAHDTAHAGTVWQESFDAAIKAGKTKKEAETVANAARDVHQENVVRQLIDNYTKVANTPVARQLAIRASVPLRGHTNLAIPGSQKLAKAIVVPSKIEPAAKALNYFNEKFNNAYKVLPDIHRFGREEFGWRMGVLPLIGRKIEQIVPKTKDGRIAMQQDIVHGLIDSPEHKEVQARLHQLQALIDGTFDESMKLNLKDVNRWIYGGGELKKGTIKTLEKDAKGKVKTINKTPEDWLIKALDSPDWKHNDMGQSLWSLEAAVHKAYTLKAIKESLAHSFGIIAEHDLKRSGAHMVQRYGYQPAKSLGRDYEHVIFDPEVAQSIDRVIGDIGSHNQATKFWSTIAKVNRPIKSALTKYSPSFHLRNAYGDAFINHLDHVGHGDYGLAYSILRSRKVFEKLDEEQGIIPLLLQEESKYDPLAAALKQPGRESGVYQKGLRNSKGLVGADGKAHEYISLAELYAGYSRFGLKQTYSLSEFGREFRNATQNPLLQFSDRITRYSEAREDYFRLAHFINRVRENPTGAKTLADAMSEAAARVRKTHFDYSDFTKFEKNVMRGIFPFYSWTRKMLPLMLEILATQPGKALLIPKWERAIGSLAGIPHQGDQLFPGGVDQVVPSWMQDAGYVPITKQDHNGNWYLQLPSPVTDMLSQTVSPVGESVTGWQSLLSMASPVFKIPAELMKGKQFYGNIPIKSKPEYFAKQLPIGNIALQMSKGNKGSLASWLSGVSFQQNTPTRQLGELLRERDVAVNRLKHAKAGYYANR